MSRLKNPIIIAPIVATVFFLIFLAGWGLAKASIDNPDDITSTPNPTNTETIASNTPEITTIISTSIPGLDVEYSLTEFCDGQQNSFKIILTPSGGLEPYEFSPSSQFEAYKNDQINLEVRSTDGQIWKKTIIVPDPQINCRNEAEDNNSQSSTAPEANSSAENILIVPECKPRGNSGKCK